MLKHLQQNQQRSTRIFNFEGFGGGGGVHRESEEKRKSVHGPSPLQGVDEPGPKSGTMDLRSMFFSSPKSMGLIVNCCLYA